MSPQDPCRRFQQARDLINARQHQRAVDILDELSAELPEAAALWELKAAALHALGRRHSAQFALETASSLEPLSWQAQWILADCYLATGSLLAAECILEFLASRLDDAPPQFLPQLAARLGSRGRYHLALEVCRKAAEHQPESGAEAIFGAAYYMSKAGYPIELVLPVLRKAYLLAPDNFRYRLALAQTTHRCGDSATAYELLKHTPLSDLAKVSCRCCMQRLSEIFRHAHDENRYRWCCARISLLHRDAC